MLQLFAGRFHTLTQSQPKAVLSKGTMQTGHLLHFKRDSAFVVKLSFLGVSVKSILPC